jgi:signal transduction histidine kinase
VPEDRDTLRAQVDLTREAGLSLGGEVETTHRIRRQDGEVRWIKGLGKIAESADEKALFLSAAIQDITDLIRADRQVERTQGQLKRRLEELERTQEFLVNARAAAEEANLTKSRFIAMISHEIRTPINGLLGSLALLSDSALNDAQKEHRLCSARDRRNPAGTDALFNTRNGDPDDRILAAQGNVKWK